MLRDNYLDQDNQSPIRGMEHSFRSYVARRKAMEEGGDAPCGSGD